MEKHLGKDLIFFLKGNEQIKNQPDAEILSVQASPYTKVKELISTPSVLSSIIVN